jgi:hypothetical protein
MLAAATFGFAQQSQTQEGIADNQRGEIRRREILSLGILECPQHELAAWHAGNHLNAEECRPLIDPPVFLMLGQHVAPDKRLPRLRQTSMNLDGSVHYP